MEIYETLNGANLKSQSLYFTTFHANPNFWPDY